MTITDFRDLFFAADVMLIAICVSLILRIHKVRRANKKLLHELEQSFEDWVGIAKRLNDYTDAFNVNDIDFSKITRGYIYLYPDKAGAQIKTIDGDIEQDKSFNATSDLLQLLKDIDQYTKTL